MNVLEGRTLKAEHRNQFDFVVVGSGPAGATVAHRLAHGGASVAVVEDGPRVLPHQFPADGFTAMAQLYRDMGSSVLTGNAPMPFVQGRVVGGTSVVNGAISWRFPKDVYREWVHADEQLGDALPWAAIEGALDQVEQELNIAPTDPAVQGANNDLLADGAEALGIEHRPIRRNVRGCRGLGQCLQGCPEGHKLSMDQSYLPEACHQGAQIISETHIDQVLVEKGRAVAVVGHSAGGATVRLNARRAVVLAASAVQTPVLLLRSRIRHGPVGENFQCHPGASVAGRFTQPVRLWTGATQGHEVIGLRHEGLKFEALGYDLALVAMRLKGQGQRLCQQLATMEHWCQWGVALRAQGRGWVRPGRQRAKVKFDLTRQDVERLRRGVSLLGQMLLAAGAEVVTPGVHGWHERVSDQAQMERFEQEGPLKPKAYAMAVTHMFGTCRMGTDPGQNVVRPDFRHHAIEGLYVADSSVFPTNLGVNPQSSIIALAKLCAAGLLT